MSRVFSEGMMPNTSVVLGLVEQDIANKKFSSAMMKLVSVSNELSKDVKFLSLLAITQKALSDFSGHIKTLAALAGQTGSHVSYLDYMAALYAEGRLNEALDVGLHLQDQELNDINAKYFTRMMVRIYLEFCDYEGVSEVIEKYCLGRDADDLMNWAMGFVCLTEGQREQAIDYFRKSIELNAQNDQAWISLAMLHEDMGDRELALANLERALDINPTNSTGLKLMTKWHRRDLESVRNTMERLSYYLSRHSFDEEVSLCYVQVLRENNAKQVAQFELEKLLLNNPQNETALKLKNDLHESAIS